MILQQLSLLNFKNIEEATLSFSDKINCLVGHNAQGKTNIFDAIYLLSFTKSAFNSIDANVIRHGTQMSWIEGIYIDEKDKTFSVDCTLKIGQKKQLRVNKKNCIKFLNHLGTIPLVMISPHDSNLVEGGSEHRRKFMDIVLCQQDKSYLNALVNFNSLLKQRNALLKNYDSNPISTENDDFLHILEEQMIPLNQQIFAARKQFITDITPIFQKIHSRIIQENEQVDIRYVSQLNDKDIADAYQKTRDRDKVLGWTSQGIHKDDIDFLLLDATQDEYYPIKREASQGQQKSFLIALKLAQSQFLQKPILLLDDLFDKLDKNRVKNILTLLDEPSFGQIFITDTNQQNLTDIVQQVENKIYYIEDGKVFQ